MAKNRRKIGPFLLGALLLAPALSAAWQTIVMFLSLGAGISHGQAPFWAGVGGYLLFQAVFFRPLRTYVFGHELTHALAGVMSGARIKSFKVTARGGSVALTKTSPAIALAPYVVPIYPLLAIAVYWVAGQFTDARPLHSYLLFFVGAGISFHICLTVWALAQGQSDLESLGVFASVVIIVLAGSLLLAGTLKVVFPRQVSLTGYLSAAAGRTVTAARDAWHGCEIVWRVVHVPS